MQNKFDELTKGLAQSVTRRQALRRVGVGLAGIVLASVGLANKAQAGPPRPAEEPARGACPNWCVKIRGVCHCRPPR